MFIETQEYARFREFCNACRTYQYIGLCYGFPGVGKTLSARYYTDPKKLLPPFYWPSEANFEKGLENHVVLYTPPVANSPGRVASDLSRWRHCVSMTLANHFRSEEKWKLRELEESMEVSWFAAYRNGGVDADTDEAAEYSRARDAYYAQWKRYHSRHQEIQSVPVLVVIDEVDRLKMASLEQVREIFDEGGMGLVLIGMPGLEKRLARYAQFYSRVGFVHEFCALAKPEMRSLLLGGWQPPGSGPAQRRAV